MKIVIPVTAQLRDELENAEAYLARYTTDSGRDQPKMDGKPVKDSVHFEEAAGALEGLTQAMLSGMAAAPLARSNHRPDSVSGARVAFTSDDSLNAELFRAVDYLRTNVTMLLATPTALDQWKSNHTRTTVDELKRLYAKINSSIQACAKSDLSALQDTGISHLLDAAAALSKAVANSQPIVADDVTAEAPSASDTPPRRREEREGTWNPAG
jgi:hypothetical protein